MTHVSPWLARSWSICQSTTRRSYEATLQSTSNIAARSWSFFQPLPGPCRDGTEESLPLSHVGVDQSGIEGRVAVTLILRDVPEDLSGHGGDVFDLHAGQVDAGLLLVSVHDRISEPSLTPKIAVDGPLVDLGPFGHRPDGQLLPVPDRGAVEELGCGNEDPFPRLRRPLAATGAVVGSARLCLRVQFGFR
jgi:hypothetical protein